MARLAIRFSAGRAPFPDAGLGMEPRAVDKGRGTSRIREREVSPVFTEASSPLPAGR